jgi:hypothetical protein
MLLADTTIPCGAVSTRVAATATGAAVRTGAAEQAATVQRTLNSRLYLLQARSDGEVMNGDDRGGR